MCCQLPSKKVACATSAGSWCDAHQQSGSPYEKKFVSGTFLNDARGKQSELLAIGVVLKPLSKVCGRLVEDWFISHSGLRLTLLVVDPCDVPTKYFETVPVLPSYRVS